MTTADSSNPSRLDEIIAEYLAAVEAGNSPSLNELIARYPAVAEQLREFFADKERIDQLAGDTDDADKTPREALAQTLPPTPGFATGSAGEEAVWLAGDRIRYFGDYELLEEIARGGMGVVYKARQVSLNRVVALKMILAGQLASDDDVRRFHTEAEAAANLDHPAIVPIYEVGEHGGQHYYSMGYVEGTNLAERLTAGPLPPREAVELVKKLAEAIAIAHEQGVIHRDLKPGNVLLDSNSSPRVTDFGLAKRLNVDSSLTVPGQVVGTPSYMAPEQVMAEPSKIDVAADIYSLGAILYCALCGRPPFQAATAAETMLQVTSVEAVPVRQINSAVPRDLETICQKCLEKHPAHRYASAQALEDELTRFLSSKPIVARPIGPLARSWRWCRRNQLVASLLLFVAVACLAGTIISTSFAVLAAVRKEQLQDQLTLTRIQSARLAHSKAVELFEEGRLDEGLLWEARAVDTAPPHAPIRESLLRSFAVASRQVLHFDSTVDHVKEVTSRYAVRYLSQSPDRSILAVVDQERDEANVMLLNAKTLEVIDQLQPTLQNGCDVYFSPDSQILLVYSGRTGLRKGPGDLHRWSVATGRPAQMETQACELVSEDGRTAVVRNDAGPRFWSTVTGEYFGPARGADEQIAFIKVTPDNSKILFGVQKQGDTEYDATDVYFWSTESTTETPIFQGNVVDDMFVSDDWTHGAFRAYLPVEASQRRPLWMPERRLVVVELNTGNQLINRAQEFRKVSFSNDARLYAIDASGHRAANGGGRLELQIRETATDEILFPQPYFSDDGRIIHDIVWPAEQKALTVIQTKLQTTVFDGSDVILSLAGGQEAYLYEDEDQRYRAFAGGLLDKFTGKTIGQAVGRSVVRGPSEDLFALTESGLSRWHLPKQTRATRPITPNLVALLGFGHKHVIADDRLFVMNTQAIVEYGVESESIREIRRLESRQPFRTYDVSADGSRVVTLSGEMESRNVATIQMWDRATGNQIFSSRIQLRYARSIKFSPDGKSLVLGGIDLVKFDLDQRRVVKTLDIRTGEPAYEILLSPNGDRFVCFSGRTTHIINADAFEVVGERFVLKRGREQAWFSTDGLYLISTDGVDTQFLELETGLPARIGSNVLYEANSSMAGALALADQSVLPEYKNERAFKLLDYQSEAGLFACQVEEGSIEVRDSKTGQLVSGPFVFSSPIVRAELSVDGRFLVCSEGDKSTIWDTKAQLMIGGPVPGQIAIPDGISPEGDHALVNDMGRVRVLSLADGLQIGPSFELDAHEFDERSVFFLDQGRILLVQRGSVRLISLSSGGFQGHNDLSATARQMLQKELDEFGFVHRVSALK